MLLSISHNKARIFHKPSHSSGLETEALFGENFKVIKREGCWVFGSLITDKYSGWMKSCKLGPYITSTHKVSVIRSHIYDSPSTKAVSIMPTNGIAKFAKKIGIDNFKI